jgi:hypothetical protein
MAVAKALSDENPASEFRWFSFLAGGMPGEAAKTKGSAKSKAKS